MRSIYIILFLLALINLGCNSFLDVKSDKSLVVVHTLEDAQALLDEVNQMNEGKVPSWGESVSDDYYFPEAIVPLLSEVQKNNYSWNYVEYFGINNDWGKGYQPIYNANLSLDILNKIERTNSNGQVYDLAKGSALFYRSYYFYQMLVVFGSAFDENTSHTDLGIVLRLTSDFNVKSFRSTVKDCFDQIESDLKESAELLPVTPAFVTRPSKVAAYATLARLYLYKRNYEKAYYYSDLALNLKSDLLDYNGDEEILTNITATASPFKKYNREIIFDATSTQSFVYRPTGSTIGVVDNDLYMSYEDNDLRKNLFFRINSGLPYYRGSYTNSSIMFGGLTVNEQFLIKAECLAHKGELISALNVLNNLLENRYRNFEPLNNNSLNREEVIQLIRNERRKELVFRSLRFSDLKRYNKEGANITLKRIIGNKEYFLEPNSRKYNLPLPSDLISITGMEQN